MDVTKNELICMMVVTILLAIATTYIVAQVTNELDASLTMMQMMVQNCSANATVNVTDCEKISVLQVMT